MVLVNAEGQPISSKKIIDFSVEYKTRVVDQNLGESAVNAAVNEIFKELVKEGINPRDKSKLSVSVTQFPGTPVIAVTAVILKNKKL